MLGHVVGGVV